MSKAIIYFFKYFHFGICTSIATYKAETQSILEFQNYHLKNMFIENYTITIIFVLIARL